MPSLGLWAFRDIGVPVRRLGRDFGAVVGDDGCGVSRRGQALKNLSLVPPCELGVASTQAIWSDCSRSKAQE